MQNLKIYAMAGLVASLMLTGCSNDTPLSEGGGDTPTPYDGEHTYVSVHINLPTASGTRAEDLSYEDGIEEEHVIHSAYLYIYTCSASNTENLNEDEMTYYASTELEIEDRHPNEEGITAECDAVGVLDFTPDVSQKYYGLVILNPNNRTVTPKDVGGKYADWKYGLWGTEDGPQGATLMVDKNADGSFSNFYMTNALRRVVQNGDYQFVTLEELPASELCASKEEAESMSGVNIYVERGVAKVTMEKNNFWQDVTDIDAIDWSTAGDVFDADDNWTGDKVVFIGWNVSNNNAGTYPIHVIQGESNPTSDTGIVGEALTRLKSKSWFRGDNKRVMWAYTPRYYDHYHGGMPLPISENATSQTTEDISLKVGDTQYVLENCQNYTDMYRSVTSRVVFKAVYRPMEESSRNADGTFYTFKSVMYNDEGLLALINRNIQNCSDIDKNDLTLDDVDFSSFDEEGRLTVANFPTNKLTEAQVSELNREMGMSSFDYLQRFDRGVCYYAAYVRHFSDNVEGMSWSGGSYTIDQLGRYGMVRNHWYNVEILGVTSPGESGVPDIPKEDDDKEDDVMEDYLYINFHMLSWAVVTQGVDL